MPRYYFNIRKGDRLEKDPEGEELRSYERAVEEAKKAAKELLAAKVANGEVVDGDRFEIANENGEVLGVVPFRSVLRLE
jgi:hypothetical protein